MTEQPSAGGKGGTLARIYQAGFPVPDGFVVLPAAFDGDKLTVEGWRQVQEQLTHLGKNRNGRFSLAVRSSALSEDSAQASFAGEFETVLDVHTREMILEAIHAVRRSRRSERVQAYSEAKGIQPEHELAVVIQRLVRAEISGVLFTADPVTGSHMQMTGNFVYGSGEKLVSGEAEPYAFTFERPKGRYDGPEDLKPHARKLYKLAARLEKQLRCPQDIEWAVAEGKTWILQSRPITTLQGYDATTGAWNDSLTGDFLWSRNNFGEARPDVLSPFTYSISEKVWSEISFLPGYSMAGNICGRYYANVSVAISMSLAMGRSMEGTLEAMRGLLGNVPEGLDIPLVPLPRSVMLLALPRMISLGMKEKRGAKRIPEFLETNPGRCKALRQRIRETNSKAELATIWHEEVIAKLEDTLWILGGSAQPLESKMKLRDELVELVGEADANALFSSLSSQDEMLASLGPVVGVSKVANGEMSRVEYLERYGHRGPEEAELSKPRPAEDPEWLDRQLTEYEKNPVDVDALLARRQSEFEAAWQRLQARQPKRAQKLRRKIEEVGPAARLRESVRDEVTRFLWVEREWALRAGELTGVGDDIFMLTIDEVLDLLAGEDTATHFIPARKETYARYQELPPYPMIVRGRFDAFEWAADPDRRNDIYDATAPLPASTSDTITGFAGAAGRVEGSVRVLDGPELGDQLEPGEVLVAVTTNVGWTPIFPRAAAVVTDVGAPLSHAAIVARELGIPAVVGCGSATTRLRNGDRVRVDGGQGIVEILDSPARPASL
jgi:pyruvate,water dikinase